MKPIYQRVIGLDVHQAKISACALAQESDGTMVVEQREFGGFKRDRSGLAQWAREFGAEVVVMESTGIYWKSPYAALEAVGIAAQVVNARHVKTVPGRKTDVADAQGLATLARAGLLRGSFIPQACVRHLRLIARHRQSSMACWHRRRIGCTKCCRTPGFASVCWSPMCMVRPHARWFKEIIAGGSVSAVLDKAGRLRASREELFEALQPEELSASHLFLLGELMAHIEELEARMARFEQESLKGLGDWQNVLVLLQTIPGIDVMGVAMLLVEISADMHSIGSAEWPASWVHICPGYNESAGKRKSGKTRKGNARVMRLLCKFAQAASRNRCALKDKFAALSLRKGHNKSIVALAHKMLRIIFAVLKNKTPYFDRAVDYEALSVQRNAPRWMKMLIKHGYMPNPA